MNIIPSNYANAAASAILYNWKSRTDMHRLRTKLYAEYGHGQHLITFDDFLSRELWEFKGFVDASVLEENQE